MIRAAVFDVDGTLSDPSHRLHLLPVSGSRDAFYARMVDDPPIEPIVAIARMLAEQGVAIVVCTSRPKRYYDETLKWLTDQHVPAWRLLMQADDDHRPSPLAKLDMLNELRAEGYASFVWFDDREDVIAAISATGLICLKVVRKEDE